MRRIRVRVEGIVQGVGFRPFVYQLAEGLDLAGWVLNDSKGVLIEVEGAEECLNTFLWRLHSEAPPLASISNIFSDDLSPLGEDGFTIASSEANLENLAQISPDTFVCPRCLAELFNPIDRRYRYPFINCTDCGPRYSIVTGVPYDRENTTMSVFPMCPACREEYEDPATRRFHAQPNACPDCGPSLWLQDSEGREIESVDPLLTAIDLLRAGKVGAVKGLGGYHLAVDACNDEGVGELRRRKARDEKPFALMLGSVDEAARHVFINDMERKLLEGVERPIVLMRKRPEQRLSRYVAPGNQYLGIMLPYTPLHYLLLAEFDALVMTSANVSDEPIVYEDRELQERLGGIADFYLCHNRAIHTRTDDSIARVIDNSALLLRRSRGYVPEGIALPFEQPPVLALGAELKNTLCLTRSDRAFLSQHVGDLKNPEVFRSFEGTAAHLQNILGTEAKILAHDLHPEYYSSRYAESASGVKKVAVQHHHAHLASCLAEHGLEGEAIGVIFDGIGYGADGRIWGGEFLVGGYEAYERVGHFAYVPMPGGDAATKEPFRMALSYLYRIYGWDLPGLPLVESIPRAELKLYLQMIEKVINSPMTSSCGRLFDAVAALAGIRQKVSYEGQAALELEMAIGDLEEEGVYPFEVLTEEGSYIFNPDSTVKAIVDDLLGGASTAQVSSRFHNTLAMVVRDICERLRERFEQGRVVLSGGVFQNKYLTEKTAANLRSADFTVYTHRLVPPNDGGLSLGQAVIAGRKYNRMP